MQARLRLEKDLDPTEALLWDKTGITHTHCNDEYRVEHRSESIADPCEGLSFVNDWESLGGPCTCRRPGPHRRR